jgi:hypothetical protein
VGITIVAVNPPVLLVLTDPCVGVIGLLLNFIVRALFAPKNMPFTVTDVPAVPVAGVRIMKGWAAVTVKSASSS